jgi:hypothetical protein
MKNEYLPKNTGARWIINDSMMILGFEIKQKIKLN